MDTYGKYNIPESYRESWDNTIIKGYTAPSAHLTNFALTLSNPTGEYVKMPMVGAATVQRRKQRHEKKIWTEPNFNDRRVYPVMFASSLGLSDDDFVLKGTLPLSLPMLHDMMIDAAQNIPDRVLLGVVYDDAKQNCIIAPNQGDWSPYLNDGSDGVNTTVHSGQLGGLLAQNWVGHDDERGGAKNLQQGPWIGDSVVNAYASYSASLDGFNLKKTNVIPVNYRKDETVADCGLTIEKLRAARLALQLRHALQPGDEVCMAITPWQMDDLLSLEKLQNKNYGFETLRTGELNTFLGIRFLVTVDVPIVDIGGKWVRCCPMWKKSSVAFGTWQNQKNEVVKLPEYYDSWVVSVQFGYGAARRREEDVICIHCAEKELAALS